MYGDVASCMGVEGYVWVYMVMCGYEMLFMAMYGYVGLCMVN